MNIFNTLHISSKGGFIINFLFSFFTISNLFSIKLIFFINIFFKNIKSIFKNNIMEN